MIELESCSPSGASPTWEKFFGGSVFLVRYTRISSRARREAILFVEKTHKCQLPSCWTGIKCCRWIWREESILYSIFSLLKNRRKKSGSCWWEALLSSMIIIGQLEEARDIVWHAHFSERCFSEEKRLLFFFLKKEPGRICVMMKMTFRMEMGRSTRWLYTVLTFHCFIPTRSNSGGGCMRKKETLIFFQRFQKVVQQGQGV